ncbi:MAG: hypothetical protein EU539_07515 [Promethearchaeota archaeon]|nr:MAG: hypothetical protein EU539_07515 [Candidatus Lokiarchaeota archaeon]
MKIAIDVDGVLLDLMINFCKIYNDRYNSACRKEDVKHWEFFKDWEISEEECYEIFSLVYENTMNVPLISNKIPNILKALNSKYQVDIVTARNVKFRPQLVEKLNLHEIKKGIHYEKIVVVDHKPYDIKLKYEYDIYVDDNPNLVESVKRHEEIYLLLFDQPWNQTEKCEKNVIRVYNWEEIKEVIKKIEKILH